MGLAGRGRVVVADMVLSLMWVWSSVLVKMLVYDVVGIWGAHDLRGEMLKHGVAVVNMFVFAYLAKFGSYNPLTVLSSALSGHLAQFLFVVAVRIPAQVAGSIIGVWLIRLAFPAIGNGPKLSVQMHHGALTEGTLTFCIVILSLFLSANIPGSFFRKTWISSVSKVSLHILGSDLTGGCMNPASVMGWAYARGDHITREHLFVYWLAPILATLLANLVFKLLQRPREEDNLKKTE